MKKHLVSTTVLVILVAALIPMVSGCSATTTNQVSATLWSTGTDAYSDAAKAADEAIAALTQSPDIVVPATLTAGTLTIAVDEAYPPLEYLAKVFTEADGEESDETRIVGFEVDLSTAVAKKLGLAPEYVKVGFSNLTEVLTDGDEVDIAASGVVTTVDMLNQFTASDTYLSADLAICTKAGVELPDAASLQGKIVGVQTGSTSETVVDDTPGIAEKQLYPHVTSALDALADGEVDAVVVVKPVVEWILSTDSEYATALTLSGSIETGQRFAFWCNNTDQALMDAIDEALAELMQAPETPQAATTTTTPTPEGTTTTIAGSEATTTTSAPETTTTQAAADASKSVYELLLAKWGLTSD